MMTVSHTAWYKDLGKRRGVWHRNTSAGHYKLELQSRALTVGWYLYGPQGQPSGHYMARRIDDAKVQANLYIFNLDKYFGQFNASETSPINRSSPAALSVRFQSKETQDGCYGVWDRYLLCWTDTDAGHTALSEYDAEVIATELNKSN
jgi:hypothetical protein